THYHGIPVFPVILLSKDLAKYYAHSGLPPELFRRDFGGYVFWIADFNEVDVDHSEIEAMVRIVRQLSSQGRSVFALYGGYFTMILYHIGLTGVSHGTLFSASHSLRHG